MPDFRETMRRLITGYDSSGPSVTIIDGDAALFPAVLTDRELKAA